MLDIVIKGAQIVDGTGAPKRSGDIGIREGRIVALDRMDEDAREIIDADGAVLGEVALCKAALKAPGAGKAHSGRGEWTRGAPGG